MSQSQDKKRKKQRCTRSVVMVLLAWAFIGGQALLAAGSVYNYHSRIDAETEEATVAWSLIGQGADRVRLVAMQAQPDVIGSVAVFLAVAGNTKGVVKVIESLHVRKKEQDEWRLGDEGVVAGFRELLFRFSGLNLDHRVEHHVARRWRPHGAVHDGLKMCR